MLVSIYTQYTYIVKWTLHSHVRPRSGARRSGERQDGGIGGSNGTTKPCVHLAPTTQETALPNSIFDYDAYDAQVFKLPTNQNNKLVCYIFGALKQSMMGNVGGFCVVVIPLQS